MLVVFNPTQVEMKRVLTVDLYYTGIEDTADVAHEDRDSRRYRLARDYTIELEVRVPPGGMTWYVIRR